MVDKLKKYKILIEKHSELDEFEYNRLIELDSEINIIINNFKNYSVPVITTYETLSNMEFNMWFDLGNGVKFIRVEHPLKPVYYITEMTPNEDNNFVALFGKQLHNCKEICEIFEGELIETMEMDKKYEAGDISYISKWLYTSTKN